MRRVTQGRFGQYSSNRDRPSGKQERINPTQEAKKSEAEAEKARAGRGRCRLRRRRFVQAGPGRTERRWQKKNARHCGLLRLVDKTLVGSAVTVPW